VQTQGTTEITREIRIKASPETIFPFLVDSERMKRWKGVEATLEPHPGGIFRVNVTGKSVAAGEYVVVDPPRRVVFTWGWEGDEHVPPGSSTVEITLTGDGEETVVTFTHRDLPQEAGEGHAEGWDHFLPRLAEVAEERDPGPTPGSRRKEADERGRPVVHFELYGRNPSALQDFYSKAFGWEVHTPEGMNYGMVHTNASDKGIDGGIAEGAPRVNFVIEVPDLKAALDEIEQLGGKTVTPITDMGPVMFAEFSDPEGNVVGIVKADD